ncbi:helix-turn-helix transcriptional regulator [Altererythrobacter arenosus]|uniref:Helix-turn-helix transcriptional regulator n=1 Tax=Altererythrobacter arenosus TaxID=3032592 RepID=A0ABY8FRK7_9SPHN|nr:helix-turn-helix transcriptional regulator [Altererythrobacter sp. CAU 1644]WFL77651.1 helix-turn-helix transcriptional regulator [Altererythrobacter sp. CAU 1644]
MRVPNLGETELLVPLHDGVFEQPMWRTFLERLRAVTECELAGLIVRAPEGPPTTMLAVAPGERPPPVQHLFGRDSRLGEMREGRVYSPDELAGLDAPDLLMTENRHLRMVRMHEASGLEAWLLLANGEPVPTSVANLMSALVPHLRVALRVLARLERERARASMSAGAVSHIDFGWISIDRQARIVDHDEQADRFMSRSGVLRRGAYDRLTPSSPAIDRQLMELTKEFAADPQARPRAINLSQDPWIDVLVSPVRVEALSGDSKAVAVVYFRGEESSSADRCQQLVDVFNLTQSEARFAWSIAQGLSIAEAAEKHGLTIETARNYSKKIYSKTGAKGQVDFMRRVLTSVVALTVH